MLKNDDANGSEKGNLPRNFAEGNLRVKGKRRFESRKNGEVAQEESTEWVRIGPGNIAVNITGVQEQEHAQPRVPSPNVFQGRLEILGAAAVKLHGKTLTNYWPAGH